MRIFAGIPEMRSQTTVGLSTTTFFGYFISVATSSETLERPSFSAV